MPPPPVDTREPGAYPLIADPPDSAPRALRAATHEDRSSSSARLGARVVPAPFGCHIPPRAGASQSSAAMCAARLAWSHPLHAPPARLPSARPIRARDTVTAPQIANRGTRARPETQIATPPPVRRRIRRLPLDRVRKHDASQSVRNGSFALAGSIVTRSLRPLPWRTVIRSRSKSRSFTRSSRHSSRRSPAPYSGVTIRRKGPESCPNSDATSLRLSTTGSRSGVLALTTGYVLIQRTYASSVRRLSCRTRTACLTRSSSFG